MTPRSLFNVILKIFGLFFLRELINTSFQFVSALFYLFQLGTGASVFTLIAYCAVIAFYVFIASQLLFNTNKLVDLLRLDQGFDEEELSFDQQKDFPINLPVPVILTIALIVLGGFILTDAIPDFCRQFYLFFQRRSNSTASPELSYMIVSAAKIIIGLLLLGERKRIIEFVLKQQNNKTAEPE